MTHILLCAGPALLVVRRNGTLFFRRPGQPDERVPYSPENYPVFLNSARHKYDLTSVVGPQGEAEPVLSDDSTVPELRLEHLPTGETIYRLAEEFPDRSRVHSAERPATPTDGPMATEAHVSS